MSTTFDTRPAAYAVIVQEGKILLPYWVENGQEGWTLPGGGLELAEHPVDGAVREVFEETGFQVSVTGLLGVDVWSKPSAERWDGGEKPFESIRFVYEAAITGGELTHELDGTTTHAAWIPLTAVAGLNRVSLVDAGLRLWRERPRTGQLGKGELEPGNSSQALA